MSLKTKIESLLFVSIRPLSIKKLADLLQVKTEEIRVALAELKNDLNEQKRGIRLMQIGKKVELATSPDNAPQVRAYLKDEQKGELTRPALETLTIIAYRGPIGKADLDVIRGVNCALILRNLLIKGLIESFEDRNKMATYYQVTFDFLKFLGLSEAKELPDYEKLNRDENLEKLLHPEAEEIKENRENQGIF